MRLGSDLGDRFGPRALNGNNALFRGGGHWHLPHGRLIFAKLLHVRKHEGPPPMIAITPLAAEKVREISEAEGLHEQGLRLRVVGGGCAGFQYDLYFEETPTEFDERFESNGI